MYYGLEYLDGFDDDIDEWWDEYAQYQEEKDAYWISHYSKVYYNLPDYALVSRVNHKRQFNQGHQLHSTEEVTYEKLHSLIIKTEQLFSLWQKRLSHEWNKDIPVPWKVAGNVSGMEEEEGTIENAYKNGDQEALASSQEKDQMPQICPHIAMALEQFGMLHELLSPIFSDEEDSYGYYDDSDEWVSVEGDPDFSDDDELFGYRWLEARKESKREKEKSMEQNEFKKRYQESARKFYIAFPDIESCEETVNYLMTMKSWINDLFASMLSKSLGGELPQLVIEKILQYMLNQNGQLQLKIGFISKTQRFIDVEKLRLQQLYSAVLELYCLFFEILFKNQLVSNTSFLGEHIKKLFQVTLRRLAMVQEFNSWLLGEETSHDVDTGFMSGLFYCKLIKAAGRDNFHPVNEALTSFGGRYLAVVIADTVKESCVNIFDVHTCDCVKLHYVWKGETVLGVALSNSELALMLRKEGCCWIEIRDVRGRGNQKAIRLTLGASKKEVVRKLIFVEFGSWRKLLVQKDSDIVVIDVSKDSGMIALSVEKTHSELELLAAKGQYMIARDFVPIFSSATETTQGSKSTTEMKVFDVKTGSLLGVIELPNEGKLRYMFRWSVAMDTDPDSLRFILWKDSHLQLWKIDSGLEKIQDIDLSARVGNGTNLSFNKDIIAVQNMQTSHDSSYDKVDLTEVFFYEISTERTYYHETYHTLYEKPETHIAIPGGHIYGFHMTKDMIISLHSSALCGEVRIYNFGLTHEKIMGLQIKELVEKRREEELKRQIKEAEKKRLNEERMRKRQEQRLKRLNEKMRQKEIRQKKRQQLEKLNVMIRAKSYCIGQVVEWRGSYGFLEVDGIGSVFIHISDIQGKPRITHGCKIRCQLQEQIGYSRPKAVSASLIRSAYNTGIATF